MKKLAIAGAIAVAAVFGAPAVAANADPLPPSGTIVVGDAQWYIDIYGLASGWDVANVYGPNGYIYYPGYVYGNLTNYIYCPTPTATAVVTYEANGDVVIDCESYQLPGYAGVYASWHIRLYAESATGYLARTLLTIENTTEFDATIADLYNNYQTNYVQPTPNTFLTDSGSTDLVAPTDAWLRAGSTAGASVIQSSAWAKPGSTAAGGLTAYGSGASEYTYVYYSPLTIPAGATKNLVNFTNMVIPATTDAAGATAALAAADSQLPEFNTFCGRLVAGLDPNADYVAWGTPAACPQVLPATGPADGSLAGFAAAALLLTGAAVLVFVRRRALAAE